jgi:hypothetical protein
MHVHMYVCMYACMYVCSGMQRMAHAHNQHDKLPYALSCVQCMAPRANIFRAKYFFLHFSRHVYMSKSSKTMIMMAACQVTVALQQSVDAHMDAVIASTVTDAKASRKRALLLQCRICRVPGECVSFSASKQTREHTPWQVKRLGSMFMFMNPRGRKKPAED